MDARMSPLKRGSKPLNWHPRRGEICLAQIDKERPVIIISSDLLNRFSRDVCILPVSTAEHREFAMRPKLAAGEGGLTHESWAKCDQPTTIEQSDLVYPPLGMISAESIRTIEEAVKKALDVR